MFSRVAHGRGNSRTRFFYTFRTLIVPLRSKLGPELGLGLGRRLELGLGLGARARFWGQVTPEKSVRGGQVTTGDSLLRDNALPIQLIILCDIL